MVSGTIGTVRKSKVAVLLDVPPATVHSRLRLAREVFRRCIERHRAREQFEMRRMGGER